MINFCSLKSKDANLQFGKYDIIASCITFKKANVGNDTVMQQKNSITICTT
jgi:hypothetical protein